MRSQIRDEHPPGFNPQYPGIDGHREATDLDVVPITDFNEDGFVTTVIGSSDEVCARHTLRRRGTSYRAGNSAYARTSLAAEDIQSAFSPDNQPLTVGGPCEVSYPIEIVPFPNVTPIAKVNPTEEPGRCDGQPRPVGRDEEPVRIDGQICDNLPQVTGHNVSCELLVNLT